MKKRLILIFVIILCILQTGCDKKLKLSDNGDGKGSNYTVSKNISFPILDYRTLNPIATKDADVYDMEKLIYQGLISLDSTLTPQPCLAESWQYENNGMDVIFNLRNDIYWHDGKKMNAYDVAFTISALLKTRSTGASLFNVYVNNIKSTEVLGEYTIKVNFLTATNNAIENFIFPIIPQHKFTSVADVYAQNTKDFFPIGTGPYMVSDMEDYQYLKLVPNDKYYQKIPTNTITFKHVPTVDDGINLLETNEINIAFVKSIDMEKYLENKTLSIKDYPSNQIEVLGFNFTNPALADKKIRQALAYSINLDDLINNAYFRSGVKSSNVYYPNYLGLNDNRNLYKTNINKAIALIKQAGFMDRDGDGILENLSGQKLVFKFLVNTENPARVEAANMIKNCLDKLSIRTSIISDDWASYNTALSNGAYDIYIGGFSVLENLDFRFALHSAYNNPIRYANPQLDVLLDRMQSGITLEEKKQTFSSIKKILDDEIPYYCLLYKTYASITTKNVGGSITPYFFDQYYGIEDLQLEFEQDKAE